MKILIGAFLLFEGQKRKSDRNLYAQFVERLTKN